MIQSIKIENYRGIRIGELQDLPRIAVLTGPNGCGKSSVLEAIQWASGGNADASQVLGRRGELPSPSRWLVHKGGFGRASFRIEWKDGAWLTAVLETSSSGYGVQITNASGANAALRGALFLEHRQGRPRPPLHQLFTETRIRGGIEVARKLLNEVDPTIRGLEILTEGEKPLLHIAYDDRVVPAALAGDGMESLVRLALELTQRKEGSFLIEEPEAHQHSAAILRSAGIIVAAARLGSQIVLTTHSLELIDDLLGVLADTEIDMLAVYRLRLAHGDLKVQRVAGADVNAARTEIGDDLR